MPPQPTPAHSIVPRKLAKSVSGSPLTHTQQKISHPYIHTIKAL